MRNHLHDLLSPHALPAEYRPPYVAVERSLAGSAHECLSTLSFGANVGLVCDLNTYHACAERIARELGLSHNRILCFETPPHADAHNAAHIVAFAADVEALIAVGSGTLNDLCKYAAHQVAKPYAVFPTAPSMNGYLSANASIESNGFKQTLPATLPAGVFCDLEILAAAPKRLIAAGIGDTLCRSTAQSDWLLSHLLLDTSYNAAPFELLKNYESALLYSSQSAASVGALMFSLLAGGLGMVMAGGSYPASQGEHLIAHAMEMLFPEESTHSFHGEQIAVTMLDMLAMQTRLLQHKPILHERDYRADIEAAVPIRLRKKTMQAYEKKWECIGSIKQLQQKIDVRWDVVKAELEKIQVSASVLRSALQAAGCPLTPGDIGWESAHYEHALASAHFMRDRFTFLDLEYLAK